MVTKEALLNLRQHYEEQANTPFTGANRAKGLVTRIDAILDSPNKTKLLRQLPRDSGQAIDEIERMSNAEFTKFVGVGMALASEGIVLKPPEGWPACESPRGHEGLSGGFEYSVPAMTPERKAELEDEWTVKTLVRQEARDGLYHLFVIYQQTWKTVAAYTHENSAYVLLDILPKDRASLLRLWQNI